MAACIFPARSPSRARPQRIHPDGLLEVPARGETPELRLIERRDEIDACLLQLVARTRRVEQLEDRAAPEPVRVLGHLLEPGQAQRRLLLEALQRRLAGGNHVGEALEVRTD